MSLSLGRAENPVNVRWMERMLHKKVDNKNVSVPKAGKKPCECETSGDWRGCLRRRLIIICLCRRADGKPCECEAGGEDAGREGLGVPVP